MKVFGKEISVEQAMKIFWMAAIFVVFAVTRFWQLCTLPGGMHVDETGMAYDAWCLAEYGVDRHLKSWPVYLTNFGGGQSSLYAFLCAFLFKIFGYSVLMVRMPAVIFSFLTLFFGMKIVKKMFGGNWSLPYIYGSLVAICPVFILFSRFGLDCNLMLGMSTVFLYFFICAMDSGKWQYFCVAGLTGGLVLYTYALSYIVMPIFLVFSLLYVLWTKKFLLKNWVIFAVAMGILAFPLIMVQIVNMFDLPEFQLGIFTITKLPGYRISELGGEKWKQLFDAIRYLFSWDPLVYNSIPGTPVLYGITNVFFVIGLWAGSNEIVKTCKEKTHNIVVYAFAWLTAILIMGALTETTVNKLNAVYGVELMIAVYGMWYVLSGHKKIVYLVRGAVALGYAVLFLGFASYYYGGQYASENAPLPYFYATVDEAYQFICSNEEINDKVTQMAQDEVYFALASLLSPYELPDGQWKEAFVCGSLSSTGDEFNYIVEDKYQEFMQELRILGFVEVDYEGYSLFYKE